jgi:hypothetical protein
MKYLIAAFFISMLLGAGTAHGQRKRTSASGAGFTSVYSNLDKNCKTIKGHNGTDDATDCRGVGGYRVNVSTAAAAVSITAFLPGGSDSYPLALQDLTFDQRKIQLEWRLYGGKPFAVIMRIAQYGDPNSERPYLGGETGHTLIARGLKGFEDLRIDVDVKTPKANEKIRELTDAAYLEKKGQH